MRDINKQFSKNKLTFVNKAVLPKNTPMHCKAGQVLLDLCSTNQGNGSEIISVIEAYKINLKNYKTYLLLDDFILETI